MKHFHFPSRILLQALMAGALSCEMPRFSVSKSMLSSAPSRTPAFGEGIRSDVVSIQWMGAAGLYVTDGVSSFLIDPFVSRPGLLRVISILPVESKVDKVREWIERLHLAHASPILLSHTHYDHALDMPNLARELGSIVYGSSSAVLLGQGAGLPERQLSELHGSVVQIGDFQITARLGCHGPQLGRLEIWTGNISSPLVPPVAARRYKGGSSYVFHIRHPHGNFVHQASACNVPDGLSGLTASTIFLGIAAREGTHELLDPILAQTGAKRIIPIHWDDFFSAETDPPALSASAKMDEFLHTVQRDFSSLEVKVPKVGEVIFIDR